MTSDSRSDDPSETTLRREYERLAQLAGGLAHEIRNPLSTISLNLDVLKEELETGETPRDRRMEQRLLAIQKECGYLEQLLEDFLQFARGLELSREPCELSSFVVDFIQFQQPEAARRGVEISPHLASNLPDVLLDQAQFRSVLRNLTLNALQAMPDGGVLEFQTYQKNDHIVLEVIDTGNGISPRVLEHIFDLFYSTKPSGNGLGLPTVRKIVEAHHGEITCDSEPGKGTRFRIALPIHTAAAGTSV